MKITKDKSDDSKNLREQAEERAKQQIVEFRKQRGQDTAELVHELHVHQIELEIQNEELRNTQLELAESRNKYCELFDFAPVGYFTLNKEGLILGANLTGAAFLGEERDNLLKSKFSHFIVPDSQDEFYLHRRQVVESGARQSCEIKLRRKDGTEFTAQLVSVAVAEQKGEYDQFRMTMTDITERKQAEKELRESELQYRSLFENMVEGVAYCKILLDENGCPKDFVYLDVNKAFEKLTGLKNVVGKKVTEAIPGIKDSNPELFEIYGRVALTGKPERFEIYLSSLGIWLSISAYSPQKGHFVAVFENITERKRAEEALKISETRFKELFNNMSSGVAVYEAVDDGSDFIVRDFNVAAEKIEKLNKEDITGKRITEVFPGVKEMGMWDVFCRVWKTGQAEQHPTTFYKDNRISGWRENYVYKLPCGELVAVYDDVTERKLAQEQLQNERNLLRTLIDQIPDDIYVKDKDGRFVICNKSVTEFWTSQDKRNLIGKTDFDLFEPAVAQQYLDEEQTIIRTGKPVIDREGEVALKNGKIHRCLTSKLPLLDNLGNIVGIVGINRDITERKLTEEKLLGYQKQLKQVAAQLALTEERERRRIAGELHDHVSQSLALAKIKLDSLQAALSSQPIAGVIEDISNSIEKAIQDTRTLTFDLSNPILYELGFEAAVSEWLNENVRDKHKINTEFNDDGRDKPLDDDMRALLFRNVRELLINTIKYSNADKVRVSVRRIDGSIEVIVEDNGVGFDPVEVRTLASKRAEFGLFSIRENLDELGGRFEIESKPGAGCKATMTAPLKSKS